MPEPVLSKGQPMVAVACSRKKCVDGAAAAVSRKWKKRSPRSKVEHVDEYRDCGSPPAALEENGHNVGERAMEMFRASCRSPASAWWP
ncbi:hypothetical protein BRADI_3g17544v3 [Brachypodium distachyon]|uniref:Uncharacterized protein n=1 Tax=Brachypodium distachyon TaxID=15368 RepID=A0A2K2CXT6_BRADI|nr:hypothetical protein BRADI_3g17544v3 [Brachypodium distachyon]